MALMAGFRWKPDAYRNTLNTTIAEFDETVSPPHGDVIMVAQAVTFDTLQFAPTAGQPAYQPGHPDTEWRLCIIYEEVFQEPLATFVGLTYAQADALWAAKLAGFRDRMVSNGTLLVRAIRPARVAAPLTVGPIT